MRSFWLTLLIALPLLSAPSAGNPSAPSEENSVTETEEESGGSGFENEFMAEFEEEMEAAEPKEEFDPLSGYNRVMTSVNDGFYTHLLFPVARGYRYIVPEGGRLAISRFFKNLLFPVRFVNNVLQLKFSNAGEETVRFVTNSTVGVLGLFDPAKAWFGLEAHDEDFGQTLGHYGVGGGFHIVLPLLGPSNLRDTLSLGADWQLDPLVHQSGRFYNLTDRWEEGVGLTSYNYLNDGSFQIEEYESLKKDAVDLYTFFKNVYQQNRQKQIEE